MQQRQLLTVTISSANEDLTLPVQVEANETVENLKALIEVSTGILHAQQRLSFEGRELNNSQTLSQVGVKDNDLIILNRGNAEARTEYPTVNWTPEQVQNYFKSHPNELQQLLHSDPTLAEAVLSEDTTLLNSILQQRAQVAREKEMRRIMEINAMELDPLNPDNQRKIEQEITQANVDENMETALEYNPEAFGRVVMLYIDVEVNGHPLKAFVDSGAQMTIMSVECAQRCGMTRLVDRRWAGLARGVGTAEIAGRVHVAQMKIGKSYFASSFTILANNSGTELLLGLDMLKKHQCCIDLKENVLRIGDEKAPFLSEKDIPLHVRFDVSEEEMARGAGRGGGPSIGRGAPSTQELLQRQLEQQLAEQQRRRTGSPTSSPLTVRNPAPSLPGVQSRVVPPASSAPLPVTGGERSRGTTSGGRGQTAVPSSWPEASINTLVNLGFSRQESIGALSVTQGNVEAAASYLFSRSSGF